MKQLFPRGKRIRPTDKDLVFHTALAALSPVFMLVVLLFHIRQIAGTNWQEVSLSQIAQDINIPYLLFSMGVAGLVCLTAVLLFWRLSQNLLQDETGLAPYPCGNHLGEISGTALKLGEKAGKRLVL